MTSDQRVLPAIGEIWLHTKSGQKYRIKGFRRIGLCGELCFICEEVPTRRFHQGNAGTQVTIDAFFG